jgi:hypothetical protein
MGFSVWQYDQLSRSALFQKLLSIFKILSSEKAIGNWVQNRKCLRIFQVAPQAWKDHFKAALQGL